MAHFDYILRVSDLDSPTSEISEALTQHAEKAVTEAVGPQVEAAKGAAVDAGQARDDARAAKALADKAVSDARGYAEEGAFLLDKRGDVSGTLNLSGVTTKNIVHARLTGNLKVILPSAPVVGQTITLVLTQDATGGRTLTMPNAVASFGVPITLSTAANAVDVVHLLWDGVRWSAMVGALSVSIPTSWIV